MHRSRDSTSHFGPHVMSDRSELPTPRLSLYRLTIVLVVMLSYLCLSAVQTEYANHDVQTSLTQVLHYLAKREATYGSYKFLDGNNIVPDLPSIAGSVSVVSRLFASTQPGVVSIGTPPSHYAKMVTLFEESSTDTCWAIAQVLPSQDIRYALFHRVPKRTPHYYYTAIHGVTGCSWNDTEEVVDNPSSWHSSWPQGWTW